MLSRPFWSRHHTLNDLVARAFVGVPVAKETVGLVHQDGKKPDGLIPIPFEDSRPFAWDVKGVCSMADSLINLAVHGPGCVEKIAAGFSQRGEIRHSADSVRFPTIVVETLAPINLTCLI